MTSSSRYSKLGKQASRTCLIFISEGATAFLHNQTGETTSVHQETPLEDAIKTEKHLTASSLYETVSEMFGPPYDPLVALYGQLCGDAIYIQPRQQPDGSFLYDYQDVGAQMQGQIGFNKTGLVRDDAIAWGQHCVEAIKMGQTGDTTDGKKDGE